MYKNQLNQRILALILLFSSGFFSKSATAQLSLTGQLRTRGELRDGYGTLEPIGGKTAACIAQQTWLVFNYKSSRLIFQTSAQATHSMKYAGTIAPVTVNLKSV